MRPVSRIEWTAMAAVCAAMASPVWLHPLISPQWIETVSLAMIMPAAMFFARTILSRPG